LSTNEQDAQQEIRRLHRLLDSLKRGGAHESAESRLVDLEQRIAAGHVQIGNVEAELKDLDALETARHAQIDAKRRGATDGRRAATGAQLHDLADRDLADWQVRGKRADLHRLLEQYRANVAQLEQAAQSIRALSKSDRWTSIGAVNRRCPGCGAAQWTSPFCPTTGNRHLGYQSQQTEPRGRPSGGSPRPGQPHDAIAAMDTEVDDPDDPEPQYSAPGAEELNARVEGSLRAQEWLRQVQVGTFNVTYRHEVTGDVVVDLAQHFMELSKKEHETRHADWVSRKHVREARREAVARHNAEVAEMKRLADEAAAAKLARGDAADTVQRGFGEQVRALVEKLNSMTKENQKLRGLLAQAAKSGVIGWHPPQHVAAAPPAVVRADTTAAHSTNDRAVDPSTQREVIPLHDEDDSQTLTKLNRLQLENTELNRRCSDLILDMCKKDERVDDLQRIVLNLQQVSDPNAPSVEYGLRSELADLRAKLVVQERRAQALDDELRRLKNPRY
jgi:uncharacterized coiled-coil protein SlyX